MKTTASKGAQLPKKKLTGAVFLLNGNVLPVDSWSPRELSLLEPLKAQTGELSFRLEERGLRQRDAPIPLGMIQFVGSDKKLLAIQERSDRLRAYYDTEDVSKALDVIVEKAVQLLPRRRAKIWGSVSVILVFVFVGGGLYLRSEQTQARQYYLEYRADIRQDRADAARVLEETRREHVRWENATIVLGAQRQQIEAEKALVIEQIAEQQALLDDQEGLLERGLTNQSRVTSLRAEILSLRRELAEYDARLLDLQAAELNFDQAVEDLDHARVAYDAIQVIPEQDWLEERYWWARIDLWQKLKHKITTLSALSEN